MGGVTVYCAVKSKTVAGGFYEYLMVISLLLLCCCSDEACTSGQLVIASRESQYKILHFHHAGLDKLAEVFQQWKCCRETQLKDQVRRQSRNRFYRASLFSTLYSNIPFFPLRRPSRNPACSFLSRGPPCRQLRPTRRRSFIGGSMSALGCVILTRMGRWRRSISYARYSVLRTCPSLGLPPESHCESHYCGLQLSVLFISSQSLKKAFGLGQYSPVSHSSSLGFMACNVLK